MASFFFNSFWADLGKGNIDLDADTFRQMLVTSSYTPNKATHTKRDDVSNEVANGGGYTTGGAVLVPTVTVDNNSAIITYTFPATSWSNSTITAAGSVVYKARGGAASADELVYYNDFGGIVTSSTAAVFTVSVGRVDIPN